MTGRRVFGFGALALFALATAGGVVEMRRHAAETQTRMGLVDPAGVAMAPAPIPSDWIIAGHPKTEAAEIAHTDDGSTHVYVWQTTASRFHWNYDSDEIVNVLDGEVFVDDGNGERRLAPGSVAFFPAGARTTWRVPDHLRKIATLKRPTPGPVAALQRWARFAKDWIKPTQAFAGE